MTTPDVYASMEEFLTSLGLDELTPEAKQDLLKNLEDIIAEEVEYELSQLIPEALQENFAGLSEEEQKEYLDTMGIDVEAIAYQKGLALRMELLESTAYAEGFVDGSGEEKDPTSL